MLASRLGVGLSVVCAAAGMASSVFADSPAPDPVQIKGVIDEVTVYRGQALVSRAVALGGTGGLEELIVTDLPEHVVPGSLYAEATEGVEVRSVRFRVRPVMQDVNEEVRKLDDKIRDLDDKLKAVGKRGELLAEHKAYLAKLEGFVAPAANVEMSKGVLNAETLTSLTQLLLTQRQTIADTDLKLGLEQRALAEQKTLAVRERDTIAGQSNRTVREAVVLVNVPAAAGRGGVMHLRYLVDAAGWSPSYTVRADGKKDKVLVEYHAAIQQMSGEDWGNVAMTLSTATPSLVSRAPELKPMLVSLGSMSEQKSSVDYQRVRKELAAKQQQADNTRAQSNSPQFGQKYEDNFGRGDIKAQAEGVLAGDQALNTLACDMQLLDLLSTGRVVRVSGNAQKREEGLSITYTLAAKTSLPSRADVQQVQIASMSMPAEFYKVATPVLTEYVYDEASVSNDSKVVLLAGPVAAYSEGRFVGSGEVATIAGGEKFIVGFGIDSSLRASRELVEKTDNVQGGNRIVDLTYRLAIDNFGETAAKVRLLDRLPKAREGEIKLTLTDGGGTQATEPDVQKKTGILRWDVTAAAAGSGSKAFALEYKFRLEHDKQLMISGMPVAAK